jgi:hypothetical protein
MNKFRLFTQIFKEVKETPHSPELTEFLSNSEHFQKAALKVHDMKLKFWRELDKAAFPEEYKDEKFIEDKNAKGKK